MVEDYQKEGASRYFLTDREKQLRDREVSWEGSLSHTYAQVLELDQWIRRRVRMCFWKQWQRPRTRRRHLLVLGVRPDVVHLATRCRRGYWWISGHRMVQRARHNFWLEQPGVPNLRQRWIDLHYGRQNPNWDPASANLTGIA